MLCALCLSTSLALCLAEPPTRPAPVQPMNAAAAQHSKSAHETDLPIPGVINSGDATCCIVETVIDAPVSKVWWVFSTTEGFKMFGVAHCDLDLRRGGLIRSHYDPKGTLGDPGTIENQIIDFEPERMMAFRIHRPPTGFPFPNAWKNTWSIATLRPEGLEGNRTRLRLAGLGYTPDEESQKMRAFFEKGNAWTLDKLRTRLAGSQGVPAIAPPSASIETSRFVAAGDKLESFSREVVVNAAPVDVFRAWTTGEGVKSFLGVDNRVELAIGGPFEFYFGKDMPIGQRGSDGCQILAYVPSRMLAYSWNAPPKFPTERELRTWVVLFFSPLDGGKTRVELVHSGFGSGGNWPEVRQYFERAWPNVLKALQDHFDKSAQSTPGR